MIINGQAVHILLQLLHPENDGVMILQNIRITGPVTQCHIQKNLMDAPPRNYVMHSVRKLYETSSDSENLNGVTNHKKWGRKIRFNTIPRSLN
jgi:hypothetical protein